MKLFIIRHGDPDYANDTLTERGWREAELLRDRMLRENITKVYLSPLGRAQDTAKPFLYKTGLTAETLDWLMEYPRAAFEPRSKYGLGEDRACCPWDLNPAVFEANREQLSDLTRWSESEIYTKYGCAEYGRMVENSLDGLLTQNGMTPDGFIYRLTEGFTDEQVQKSNIAIFCHMGLGSYLTAHLAHVAPPLYWQTFRVMPTSVTTVTFHKTGDRTYISKIFTVGDVTHLAPIGLTYRW